jgi:hypothetical protein
MTRLVQYKPTREILMTHGVLLASSEARYPDLNSYMLQFSAPLSSLCNGTVGLFSFADPLWPERSILLQCTPEPVCERCQATRDECDCRF